MSVIYFRFLSEILPELIWNKIFEKIFEDLLKKIVNFVNLKNVLIYEGNMNSRISSV